MNHDEFLSISSEIKELESLLAEVPEENVIERMGLEARLESARRAIANVREDQLGYKARLTFRGKPVFGSHGIAADFASKAAGAFSDAVAVVAAGLAENLRYMGPIPDRQKNQLLITGTAVGSFGFEFELPQPETNTLFPEPSKAENALQKMLELFQLITAGSDDDVAELIDEIHPRAVKKAADFLDYLAQQDAWCGLEFKERFFRFRDVDHLRASTERLREDNIREAVEEHDGELQGVLPTGRTFEFKTADHQEILRGKIGLDIEDADILNRDFLHKPVRVRLHVIRVGQGRPRYSLRSIEDITASDATASN
ncbi:MAG: hypothetical protein V1792_04090 [Pseudomonadota bacterium]